MKTSLIALLALFLIEFPRIGRTAEDLDAFFTEAGVWPAQMEDVREIAFYNGHYFVLNGYRLQILEFDFDTDELIVIGTLEFEDFGDPSSPDDGLRDIVLVGSRAYIKEQRSISSDVWHAVDIGDLTEPELEAEPEFAAHRFFATNGRVAVSSILGESKLFEVDESGGLALRYSFESSPWGLPSFLGDYLILQLEGSMLTGVDVSDLTNPVVKDRVDVPNLGDYIYSWRNFVFNRRLAGLEVYDFTVPTDPKRVTTLVIAEPSHGGSYKRVVDYPFLYTGRSFGRDNSLIEAFNISDPTNPRLVGHKEISGGIYGIEVANSQLLVVMRHWNFERTDLNGELLIFDLAADFAIDSDRDGVTDVTEFAVGGEKPGIISSEEGAPTFQYQRSAPAIPNFDYVVEVSDLQSGTWGPAPMDLLLSSQLGDESRSVPLESNMPYARLRVSIKE